MIVAICIRPCRSCVLAASHEPVLRRRQGSLEASGFRTKGDSFIRSSAIHLPIVSNPLAAAIQNPFGHVSRDRGELQIRNKHQGRNSFNNRL